MNKFIRDHQEAVLVFFVLLFLALIVGFFIWGIYFLLTNLTSSISPGQTGSLTGENINIDGAKKVLDAKGLLP